MTEIDIGVLATRRWAVIDAKGNDVFIGDNVVTADLEEHEVASMEAIDMDHAWIIDQHGNRLVPHLTEKVAK